MAHAGHTPPAGRRCLRLRQWHRARAGQTPRHQGQGWQGDFCAQPSPPTLGPGGSTGAWLFAEYPLQGGAGRGHRDHHDARTLGGTGGHVLIPVTQPHQKHQECAHQRAEGQPIGRLLLRLPARPC
ncbi:hypothetical protein VPH35_091993 [Triticum aestivum]